MDERPQVTVVIPTRDRCKLVSMAIASALGQEDVSLEVIVVDDGSRDGTSARVSALQDPRVRVLRHDRPQGPAKARNRGVADARGMWVAFLDDDDIWSPRKLRIQIDRAASQSASWAYAAGVLLDEERRVVKTLDPPDPKQLGKQLLIQNVMPGGSSNVVVKAELIRHIDGFDEGLSQLADWDLWIRLAHAENAVACPEVLVGYLGHRDNMLATDTTDVMSEFEYLAKKHGSAASAAGCELDRALFVRFVAFGQRRAGRRARAARTYLGGAVRYRNAGNVARAVGALLGERAMSVGRRIAGQPTPPDPTWLACYRDA
jgi:glycosyltransferase involved in cell wall biosynthesis